jgi:radical SAM protein with 4Fe4S-binding SPASM domain
MIGGKKDISGNQLLPPLQLFLELTTACNLCCSHCYLRAGEGKAHALPASDIHGLLGEFQALGGEYVSFSGGEPTLYREWRPVMRYARYLGLDTMLVTNGIRLDDGDIRFLADIEADVAVSLDGAVSSTNDAIRGAGSFARTTTSLQRLFDAGLGPKLTLCFTPSIENYRELSGIVKLADRIGIGTVYVSLLELRGRAADAKERLALDAEAKQKLVFTVYALQDRHPGIALECLNLRYFTERLHGHNINGDCLDRTVRVTSDGELYLTAYLDDELFHLGHYASQPLHQLWYSEKVRSAFQAADQRKETVAECRDCLARLWCQGGSATFAWAAHGRFDAVDGFCEAKQMLIQELHKRKPPV